MPRIIVAGGTGFIGNELVPKLVQMGYDVIVLTRSSRTRTDGARELEWDARTPGGWAALVDGSYAVVNLAGRSVNTRHTAEHKREILESRVESTRVLGQAIAQASNKPRAWIQASTLAIYGDPGDLVCDESSPVGDDFSVEVAKRWEDELFASPAPGVRKVVLRIGFALGRLGGALGTLAGLARWFLGGSAGNGRQYVSWLHIADLVEMIIWSIERDEIDGVFNACTPMPVTNAEFMRTLRQALHRPWSPPVPVWAVKFGAWLMGTEAHLALEGRRCVPTRFVAKGFQFRFPDLRTALSDLLN